MASREQISETVRGYLLREVLRDAEGDLDEATPLYSRGILDSITFIALIAFIEKQLGIWIPDADLIPQNFETLDVMSRMLERASTAQNAARK